MVSIGGVTAFAGINLFKGNEKFYRQYVMPIVHNFVEPENAHRLAVLIGKYRLFPKSRVDDTDLLVSENSPKICNKLYFCLLSENKRVWYRCFKSDRNSSWF